MFYDMASRSPKWFIQDSPMPKVSFTKADLERALSATRAAGIPVGEVRIEKTPAGALIRILSADLPSDPGVEDDVPRPEPW